MSSTASLPLTNAANAAAPLGGDHLDASDTMKRVVQGAHDTVDRLAGQAAPQVQRLEHGVAAANQALQARAELVRSTVRDNPLVSVLAALAIGVLVARIVR